jgi:hypothetical protein
VIGVAPFLVLDNIELMFYNGCIATGKRVDFGRVELWERILRTTSIR